MTTSIHDMHEPSGAYGTFGAEETDRPSNASKDVRRDDASLKADAYYFREALERPAERFARAAEADKSGRDGAAADDLSELFRFEKSTAKKPLEDGRAASGFGLEAVLARGEADALARFGATGAAGAESAGAAKGAGAPAGDEALEALVSRILVGSPERGGTEVRITLDARVLADTEISLVRGTDGLLSVRIASENPASFQTLVAARNELAERLSALEKGPVAVTVSAQAESENNDARRESRGRTDCEPEVL